jgi:hypothetical protein
MSGLAREFRLLEGFVKSLAPLGYAQPQMLSIQQDAVGVMTLYVNFSATTPATGNLAAFVRLVPVGSTLPLQTRALDYTTSPDSWLHSSVVPEMIMEAADSATPMSAQAKFNIVLQTQMVHQLSPQSTLKLTEPGTLAEVAGINGATVDANIPAESIELQQFGRGFAGGA